MEKSNQYNALSEYGREIMIQAFKELEAEGFMEMTKESYHLTRRGKVEAVKMGMLLRTIYKDQKELSLIV